MPREDYAAELYGISSDHWNVDQHHAATAFYFDQVDDTSRDYGELATLNAKLNALAKDGNQTMVAADTDELPLAYVLTRGVYTATKRSACRRMCRRSCMGRMRWKLIGLGWRGGQ